MGWKIGVRRSRGKRGEYWEALRSAFYPNSTETMLKLAVLFLIIAIAAGIFGFGGIAGTSAWIAQVLFVIFLILFVVSFFFGRRTTT